MYLRYIVQTVKSNQIKQASNKKAYVDTSTYRKNTVVKIFLVVVSNEENHNDHSNLDL